jgi:hypothetical protein
MEYVAMPDGSSSAAPVMTPGPIERKNRYIRRLSIQGEMLGYARDHAKGLEPGTAPGFGNDQRKTTATR